MMRNNGLVWVADFARLINETVRDFEGIEQFRQMVRKWYQEYMAAGRALDEWRRRREAHGKRIAAEPGLQCEDSVPPEAENSDDYRVFTELVYETDPAYDVHDRLKCVTGWLPIELLHEPCANLPLPVPERALTIPERYAVAAVIHDAVLPVDPINPWHDEPPWWEHEDKKQIPGMAFAALEYLVRDLRDEDRVAIETIVQSALADLRKAVGVKQVPTKQSLTTDDSAKKQSSAAEHVQSEAAFDGTSGAEDVNQPTERAPEPDSTGYVMHPRDPSAYVSATEIVSKHAPAEMPLTAKQLTSILRDYAENRIRWTQPVGKDGVPRPNRRNVHLADWMAFVERRRTAGLGAEGNGWPAVSEGEIAGRTAAIRQQNLAGK